MAVRAEIAGGVPDAIKWIVAVTLLGAATVGFYVFAEESLLLRVIGLLVVAGVSLAIVSQTEKGRIAWEFIREARTEVRKVVWPTRRETGQTTLIVIAVVALVGLLLWMFDGLLAHAVRYLLGTGS